MTRFIVLLIAASISWLAAGCASTGLTATQRAKFEKVALEPARTSSDAYQKPDPARSPDMARKIPQYTLGGLIPLLIGKAIDEASRASQREKFEGKHPNAVKEAAARLSASPGDAITTQLRGALGERSFFRDRLSPSAETKMAIAVTRYGLVLEFAKDDDNPKLIYSLAADLTVTAKDGEQLFATTAFGYSADGREIEAWLNDREFSDKSIGDAVGAVVRRLVEALDTRLSAAR
jgi:hypothetical protein